MSQCLNPDCLYLNPQPTNFCQKCGSKLLLRERYRALKILGEGGFSKTFLAVDEDKPSQPYCVIKQLFPQAQGTNNQQKAEELFKREAIQLEQLGKHNQIPELFASFSQDNRQYLVQEYIEGQNLAQELEQHGAFSEDKIQTLLKDLLPVLSFIHQQQVIHRDIKPENIIRIKTDNKFVLVDFGAVKAATNTTLAATGTVIGTMGYIAPEQAFGKPSFASDLYSLGATCIHLLTNTEPSELYDVGECDWLWRNYLKVKVSDNLSQLLDKLLKHGTNKRFQSVEEVLEALQLKENKTQHDKTVTQSRPRQILAPKPTLVNHKYSRLENLLAAGKWKEADEETTKVMLQIAGREKQGWLDINSINNFPCEDLQVIDQFWVQYSYGRFGFSVQKEIWLKVGGKEDWETEIKVGERLGWRKNGELLKYKDLTFSLAAAIGHLPGLLSRAGYFRSVLAFLSRIKW
ncbi:phosphotransferase enzyme family protein [Lyngbya aestuarii BL J]|uniref:non-specific serine/threonine protein kinase n=1 Tax=Lyngbya aestuarii BL J TaxID=1348334 RepID=U7QLN4_9CYAN|nr:serine/threonine-protein kinase [Lyngbya aestuarii]ERT08000.1 phosphotransferase enzyme family protein [Lyngbya aestuarii BL J]